MIRESALFSSVGCLSSQQAVRRNLMSPTVVIAAGLMTRNVCETEGWQICICYNGHHSLVAPTEAHASSFLGMKQRWLFFLFYFFYYHYLFIFSPSLDLNNWWYWVKASTEFVTFNCSPWCFRSQSMSCSASNYNDPIGQRGGCETAVVRLIFLVVLFLSGHFGSWLDTICKWFIMTLN